MSAFVFGSERDSIIRHLKRQQKSMFHDLKRLQSKLDSYTKEKDTTEELLPKAQNRLRTTRRMSLSLNNLNLLQEEDEVHGGEPIVMGSMQNLNSPPAVLPVPILRKRTGEDANGNECKSAKRIRFNNVDLIHEQTASVSVPCLNVAGDQPNDIDQKLRNAISADFDEDDDDVLIPQRPRSRRRSVIGRVHDQLYPAGMPPPKRVRVIPMYGGSLFNLSERNPTTGRNVRRIQPTQDAVKAALRSMDNIIWMFLRQQKYKELPISMLALTNTGEHFFQWTKFIYFQRWVIHAPARQTYSAAIKAGHMIRKSRTREELIQWTLSVAKEINFQPTLRRNDILNPMALYSKQRVFAFLVDLIHYVKRTPLG